MPTSLDLIKRSMRLCRVLSSDQTPTDTEAEDARTILNAMLDAWQIERLMVYQIKESSLTWPSGTASRTIGAGGNFSQARPIRIDSAFYRDSAGQDSPLAVLQDRSEYDAVLSKTLQSLPEWLFYDPVYPLGVLYLYPVPSAQVTLLLNEWQTLQSFANLTTDLALPPGYQRAIEYNLALEIADEFGRQVSSRVERIAMQSKGAIKSANAPSMTAQTEIAWLASGGRANILTGL